MVLSAFTARSPISPGQRAKEAVAGFASKREAEYDAKQAKWAELTAGSRVRRNPEFWKYGDQDGGAGGEGVVLRVGVDGWAKVRWDQTGKQDSYRWGVGDAYDLEIVGAAAAGGSNTLPVGPSSQVSGLHIPLAVSTLSPAGASPDRVPSTRSPSPGAELQSSHRLSMRKPRPSFLGEESQLGLTVPEVPAAALPSRRYSKGSSDARRTPAPAGENLAASSRSKATLAALPAGTASAHALDLKTPGIPAAASCAAGTTAGVLEATVRQDVNRAPSQRSRTDSVREAVPLVRKPSLAEKQVMVDVRAAFARHYGSTESAFHAMNAVRDGEIDEQELRFAVGTTLGHPEWVDALLELVDADGSGSIDLGELLGLDELSRTRRVQRPHVDPTNPAALCERIRELEEEISELEQLSLRADERVIELEKMNGSLTRIHDEDVMHLHQKEEEIANERKEIAKLRRKLGQVEGDLEKARGGGQSAAAARDAEERAHAAEERAAELEQRLAASATEVARLQRAASAAAAATPTATLSLPARAGDSEVRVRRLESQLAATLRDAAGSKQQQAELRALRGQVAAFQQRQVQQGGVGAGALALRDELAREKAAHAATKGCLDRSRDAILHSAGASYEYEIKLQHARSALSAILEQVEYSGGLFCSTRGMRSAQTRRAGEIAIAALREELRDLAQRKARAVGAQNYAEAQQLLVSERAAQKNLAALEGKVARGPGAAADDDLTSFPSTSAWVPGQIT